MATIVQYYTIYIIQRTTYIIYTILRFGNLDYTVRPPGKVLTFPEMKYFPALLSLVVQFNALQCQRSSRSSNQEAEVKLCEERSNALLFNDFHFAK